MERDRLFYLSFRSGKFAAHLRISNPMCLEMKYKNGSGDPLMNPHCGPKAAAVADDYHRPDEKPPGGMRFLLMTWPAPFSEGTVVLISAAPPDLYPSPVTGLPFLWDDPL